jgi:NIMA-interacting peptidyl-prolyl cis-trans isomerase 1
MLKAYMTAHHSRRELGHEAGGLNGNSNSGKIRASHLLIKRRNSRRSSSWREVGLHMLGAITAI